MPFARPLTCVVGAPLHFDLAATKLKEEDQNLDAFVDAYHAQYVAALQALYDAHKGEYAAAGRTQEMRIVE
jgi:hypothetical protein